MKKTILTLSAALMSLCLIAPQALMYTTLAVDTATSVTTSTTDELTPLVVDKMKNLNTIFSVMGGSPQYTTPTDDENFLKITDPRFTMKYEFHKFVEETTSGELRNSLLIEGDDCFVDYKDDFCVKKSGRSYYSFPLDDGVEISNQTETSFTATTKAASDLYGKGQAFFIKDGNSWYIDFYQFGETEQLNEDIALKKMKDFNTILAVLGGSTQYTESTDDIEFLKITDSRFKSLEDMHKLIEETTYGEVREKLISYSNNSIIEYKGELCVKNNPRPYYSFPLEKGLTISDVSDNKFVATTIDNSDLYLGLGEAFFIKEGDNWYIFSYKYNDNYSVYDSAIIKMSHFNIIAALLGGSPKYTEATDDENFLRITDTRFKSLEDIHNFIESFSSGNTQSTLIKESNDSVIEYKGELCVKKSNRSYYSFPLKYGIDISNQTINSFTATTVEKDDLNGRGQAFFIIDNNKIYIDFYQFGEPVTIKNDINGKWVVTNLESENSKALSEYVSIDITFEFENNGNGMITASSEEEKYSDEITWDIEGDLVNYTSKNLEDSSYHLKYYSTSNELVLENADGVFVHFARVKDILGDLNSDNKIDAKDASSVLMSYSRSSTGELDELSWAQKAAADANGDSFIDAKDASSILQYYSIVSTDPNHATSFFNFMNPAGFVTTVKN